MNFNTHFLSVFCLLLCSFFSHSQAQSYCENGAYSAHYFWIESVASDDFYYSAGPLQGFLDDQDHLYHGYLDYTDEVIDWQVGLNPLELAFGTFISGYPMYWQVWVDLNEDQVFGADELVLSEQSLESVVAEVDLSALRIESNLQTRMRVSMSFIDPAPVCGGFGMGEVEDYTVNIQAPSQYSVLVPEEYASIQAAVDAALPGDRVLVNDGVYFESVVVDKALLIESVNGNLATVVSGSDDLYTFDVQSPNVTIKGFAIENTASNSVADIYFAPGSNQGQALENRCAELSTDEVADRAVYIDEAHNMQIQGLRCESAGLVGIYSYKMVGGQFVDNIISHQTDGGIKVSRGESVVIENNITRHNGRAGIYVFTLLNGLISGNDSSDNVASETIYRGGQGISLSRAEGVIISDNNIQNNDDHGIRFASSNDIDVMNNISINNEAGIHSGGNTNINISQNISNQNRSYGLGLYSTASFQVTGNELSFNLGTGLEITRSFDGLVNQNQVLENFKALSFRESNNNEITLNRWQASLGQGSSCQVTVYRSNNNYLGLNSFLMDFADLCSGMDSRNYWQSKTQLDYNYLGNNFNGTLGNYYKDGSDVDSSGNGIADDDYQLPGDSQWDRHPLVVPANEFIIQ